MFTKIGFHYKLSALALIASLSCNFLTQSLPASGGSGDLSAEATSPASVHLEWQAVAGASGYKIEGRYGKEFFPIADLPGDRTGYEHFVVPGSAQITYRLTTGDQEVGTANVTMPELEANALKAGFQQIMPAMPGFGIPNLDPNNPDPNAIPTMDLSAFPTPDPNNPGSFDPSTFIKPVSVTQEVGPEGGTVTMTSPSGATFTLDVPPGALRETIPLTLAPVESVPQAPLPFSGGLLAAVQIMPVIPFDLTLTLHVQLPPDAPAPAPAGTVIVGFDASGMSDELALHPINSDAENVYSMRVDWGDTFGLAAATPQEIAEQVKRVPADAGAQMAQMIAATQLLAPSGAGDATVLSDQILDALFAQLDQIAARNPSGPGLGSADHSIAAPLGVDVIGNPQRSAAARRLRALIEEARQGYYMYQGSPRARELLTELAKRIKIFLRTVEKQCLTEDGLFAQEIIGNLRRYAADPTHEFMFTENAFWAAVALAYGPVQDLKPCRITLEIQDSTIRTEDNGRTGKLVVYTSPIPLELVYEGDHLRLRGVGPVTYKEYEVFNPDCPPIVKLNIFPTPSLWITDLRPLFDPNEGSLVDFSLNRIAPDPNASFVVSATGVVTPECRVVKFQVTREPPDLWSMGFQFLHNTSPDQNWSMQFAGFGVAATKTVSRTVQNITEDSTLVITVLPPE